MAGVGRWLVEQRRFIDVERNDRTAPGCLEKWSVIDNSQIPLEPHHVYGSHDWCHVKQVPGLLGFIASEPVAVEANRASALSLLQPRHRVQAKPVYMVRVPEMSPSLSFRLHLR